MIGRPGSPAPAERPGPAVTVPVLAPGSSVKERERELARSIEVLHMVSHDLADALGLGALPFSATETEGLRFYGGTPNAKFRLWKIARACARVIAAHDEFRGVKRVTPAPAVALPQPDEAPGLDVPAPTGDPSETQPRLAGMG